MARQRGKRVGQALAGLALGAGVAAGYAGYRRLLNPEPPQEPYTSPYGTPEYYRWLFGNIAYNHAGQGQALLLIHGLNAGASSYEMRQIYEPLAQRFHVYTPDLLGYGLSDRPDLMYTAELYVQLIEDFVREVIQKKDGHSEPVFVIASSLCSAYAIKAAADYPERYARLVLICPTERSTLDKRDSATGRAIYELFRKPQLGRALYNALVTRPSLTYFMHKSYYDDDLVDEEMIDSYYATTHRPGARYAPSSFLSGYFNLDVDDEFASLRQPVLMVWGKDAEYTPITEADHYIALNPNARLVVYDECGILPHDERAQDFIPLVESFFTEPQAKSLLAQPQVEPVPDRSENSKEMAE